MTTSEYSEAALSLLNGFVLSGIPFVVDAKQVPLVEGLMGMCSESGEALDILKKHMFQGHPLNEEHLISEIGDVLWYMNLACKALDISLEDVMRQNIAKLLDRYGEEGFSADKSVNRKGGN